MKTYVLLTLVTLASAAVSLPRLDTPEVTPHIDLVSCIIPNAEGNVVELTPEQEASERKKALAELEETLPEVHFYLYTKENPKEPQLLENSKASIENSNFNGNRATRMFIHGWMGSLTFPSNKPMLNAWLETGDYNVFMVDWGTLAQSLNTMKIHVALPTLGQIIAEFLQTLHQEFGMSYDTLQVAGHSLGAHISGFTGKKTIALGHKIGTIIGLDTSSQCVSYTNIDERLHQDDAVFVESIHVSSPFTGFLQPIGVASFYVNGAGLQPLCQTSMWSDSPIYLRWLQYTLQITCSHMSATNFYANSIRCQSSHGHVCKDYKAALNGQCEEEASEVLMGAFMETGEENAKHTPAGIYYVDAGKPKSMLMGECEGRSAGTRNSGGFMLGGLMVVFSIMCMIL